MRRFLILPVLLGLTGCVAVSNASPGDDAYTYNDVWKKPHGHARSQAVAQTASQKCDGGDPGRIGSPAFAACMKSHGWRVANLAPQSDSAAYDPGPDSFTVAAPDPSPSPTPDTSISDWSNQEAADLNAADQAATQQYENSFITYVPQ